MTTQPNIKDQVKEKYGAIAEQHLKPATASPVKLYDRRPQAAGGCCEPGAPSLAKTLYDPATLTDLPDSVTGAALGCGNPTAIASLKPGETVLDLGSGGGIDCFLAAKAVGPTGRVIGVDMTDQMLTLANQNKAKLEVTNVEFRKGDIENLPVENDSVDVIISNCVINLAPDKDAVFREALRVLKPGGRLTVSDIVTDGDISDDLHRSITAWVGCIAGALDQNDYLAKLRQAGFVSVAVKSRTAYGLEALDMLDEKTRETLSIDIDLSAFSGEFHVYGAKIVAYKPN